MQSFGKRLAVLAVLVVGLICSPPPATIAAPANQAALPGRPIELRLDPNVNSVRIPAPPQFSPARAPTMSINVNYTLTGLYGDSCTAWPAQAQTAFAYAASIWGALLTSSVPLTIDACWATNLSPGVLGHGGPIGTLYRNFPGAPVANTWYPVALANSQSGLDRNGATAEIYIALSSIFNWYSGTNGVTPAGQIDLVSVALHEMGHGLGFIGSMRVNDGSIPTECSSNNGFGCWGLGTAYPVVYDRFAEDLAGNDLINPGVYPNPSGSLASALKSGNVYFNGANANAANGGARVPLYAPATWRSGSSYAHLDYNTYRDTINRLMVYMMSSGSSIHDPGPVTTGIMQDIGWQFSAACYTLTTGTSPGGSGSVNANPVPNCAGATYNPGSVVTLTASANSGYVFFGWAGDAGGSINPTTVTLNANRNVTASFNPTVFTPKYLFLPFIKK